MKRLLIITASVLALAALMIVAACLSPEGIKKNTWSKSELVDWYAQYRPTNERLARFGYRGSDDRYHYFITRPIDSFLTPRVPRAELQMEDERPLSLSSSAPLYHYVVDPLQDFKKVPVP